MDSTQRNRPLPVLQDKTNLISDTTTYIKQSGKGLRSPVEKASEVSSPTSKSLAKSVSKQTISSDSCSFNSALQSSDTDATATADYDSAGESEFVLAPDSHEQKENLDLTLLANCLDGIHIASPQSDSHSPHDCSLFAVKFTKGELSAQDQEELSSEPCDQENEESLSGILNLSSISSEEITRTTPLEYLASEQNSEKKRLSAAKNFAAESDEIDPPVDAFDILESQLQAENPFNESNVSENRRSFSGILNISDVSYEEIPVVGLIPNRDLNASLQNHANSEVEANNTTETVETSDQLIENRPHFEETSLVPRPLDLTAENIVVLQTADNKNDLNESVEKLSINRSHLEETSIDPRPLNSTTESIVVLQNADSKKDLNDPVEEISSKEFDRPLENSVLNSSLNATAPPAPVELEHPVDSTFQLNSVIRTSSSSEHQSESRESAQEEIDEESPKKSLEEKSVKIGTHSPDETNTSVASVDESLKSHEIHSNSFTSCTTDKNVINSTLINEPAVGKCSQVDDKTQESPEIGTKFTVESSDGSRSTLHIDSVATNLFDPSTEIKETAEVSSDLFQTVSPLIQSEVLSENSDCTVEIQNSNIVTNIQEDLKGLSPSDSKCNNADLNNDSPANVSISKELSVTITDDLTHTVISDLLTKAGNLVSSDSQDLLNGSHKQDNLSFNCNLESECKDTKPECAEAVSLVNEVILATVSNPSGCKEVQSPENVLNVQTSCLDASVDKLNESTVQAAPDIVEVDQLNSTSFSKAVTDDGLNGEGIAGVQKEGILENEDGIFCKEPVTGSKTSFEFVKKSSETLNNYQETEEKIQQTITANLQEPLKFDQIVAAEETEKIVLRSIGTQLNLNVVDSPSVADTELNGNIIKSETNLLSPVSGTPRQESSVEAKEDLVSERSDLNASSTSLDESLPLLDAIDESFEVRTEDKFVNLNSSLKSSENQCPEQEKIVSTKFCIANLNKSATDETILESAILDNNTVEKTNTSVSEPVENCLKPAALNGHNTLGYDLKNNNSPEVISVPDSPKSIGISSSSNTTQVEEGTCYGINAITENNNRSLSQNLDDVPTPKTVEGPVVGELKTEVSADLAKDILQEAFNKLSIEIRGDLSKNQSSLIEEPSKLPDNSHFNVNPTINQVDLSIYTEEKQLVEESDVVEIESKSEILTVDSKDSQIESLEPICEKNENIEELNFDDSLTEQALNLSREILLNSEDQMSDNFTVEMDNRMSSSAKTDGPKSNRVSFESNGHGVGEDLDKTFEMQSESPTFDSTANSSEAGPITAEEFTIPASAFQFDLDSLPCGVRNARLAGAGLTRNSLYVKFDPIVGKILANTENSPGPFLPPPTTERLEGSSLERTPMKNPALDEKLISITPCSTVGSGNANSSFTEQLDSSIDSESNKTVENATLNKTDPDITQRVRNLSFEAESKQAASSLTPQTNKHQTSKTTPRGGTVVSQEYYLKELEKLQDLMSKQEQGYQEELNRNTEKMEKLQIEVSSLKKEMHSKAKALSQSEVVLGEYERTIAKLVAQNEADKKQFELLKEKLIQERDTVTIHLNNTEIAFNDVHQKYERSKLVIEEMKNVQDTLKASNQEYEKLLKAQEDKYNKLRSHVAGQLEKASHEMETMIRNHKDENDRLRARLKQAEIANKSLESANEQKTKENKELTQILDELIGKVGADGV